MTYFTKAVVLMIVLTLTASNIVLAGSYITDAAEALRQKPVYVAPGTEGTNADTAGMLQSRLTSDDNIVLVMLPAGAEAEIGLNVPTIAIRLSEELGNQRIIGLSVGRKVVGYAPGLPVGVAADQMRRAESVSNDPITALGTFVQNMHLWQADHPDWLKQAKPAPFQTQAPKNDVTFLPPAVLVSGLALASLMFIIKRRQQLAQTKEKTRFRAPEQVGDLLEKIARQRPQIQDPEFQAGLFQMCVDIERYFKSGSKDKRRDARFFNERLTEVSKVLDKYVDVQDNERYYRDPATQLLIGKESITGFADFVLESIKRGHDVELLDYRVDTNILQAQRYSLSSSQKE